MVGQSKIRVSSDRSVIIADRLLIPAEMKVSKSPVMKGPGMVLIQGDGLAEILNGLLIPAGF